MPVSPDDAADLAKGLLELYADAELRLLELIGRAVADGVDTPAWQERQLLAVQRLRQQTKQLLADLQEAGSKEAAAAIQAAYNRGAAVAGVDLASLSEASPGLFGGVDTGAVSALVQSTTGQLASTGLLIASQQDAIYRDVVHKTAAAMLTGQGTRRQASWAAMQTWADRGVTGFVDSAGRNWSMSAYAEMVARTSASQAIIQGHADRLTDIGQDLVMISDAPEECERCRPWEGKVLSLTGRTKPGTYTAEDGSQYTVVGTLSAARAAGLFHPNCRHRTVLFLPGITRPLTDTADPEGDKLRQTQRYKERRIRTLKKRAAVAEQVAGKTSPEAVKARGKLAAANQDFKVWRDTHGRKDLSYRTSIKTPTPPKPVAANPLPGPQTNPLGKTQLTGSFDPKPAPIVKTQLTGSFAPKIQKTQLTGSFDPKVQKTQLTGSFDPKAPTPPPKPVTPLQPKPAGSGSLANLKAMMVPATKTATPAQVKQAVAAAPAPKPPAPKAKAATPKPVKAAQAAGVPTPTGSVRSFKSGAEGREWASSVWPDAKGYNAEQLHALKTYTGEGFTKTNTALRKSKGARGGSRGLNSAMNAAPRVPEPILVTRGTTESAFGVPKGTDLSSMVGKQFTEHGYLSTSVDSRPGIGGRVHMNMTVPAGYKAVYVSGKPGAPASSIISDVGAAESELILNKGVQFAVTSVRKVKGGWVVDASVLPAD